MCRNRGQIFSIHCLETFKRINIDFFQVQPGDTLASLSLKYNIPVAELKRVNNIVTETHFYALKRMKIPVKTASLLTEMLPSVHEAKGEAKYDILILSFFGICK